MDLVDPDGLQVLLSKVPPQAKRHALRRVAATDLVEDEPGRAYRATVVDDGVEHFVDLAYDEETGWVADCECSPEGTCAHVYRGIALLLGEHRRAAVQALSSGATNVIPLPGKPRESEDTSPLVRRYREACGNKVDPKVAAFLKKVHTKFLACGNEPAMAVWDLLDLGLSYPGYGWDRVRVWPRRPKDDYEFWLYVANAALEKGEKIPRFMEPVTDLTLIQKQLAAARREEAIDQWTKQLSIFRENTVAAGPSCGQFDLRVRVEAAGLRLLVLLPGKTEFEELKLRQFESLLRDYNAGTAALTDEADLILPSFRVSDYATPVVTLRYDSPMAVRLLNRAFRGGTLSSHIVDARGAALRRAEQPLKWSVVPGQTPEEDYVFRLVQADETPAPPILLSLPGSPVLHVTAEAVYAGPPSWGGLDLRKETRIPVPAVEQESGLALLESLGVGIPEHLARKIRRVPFQVHITCELAPIYHGSETEDCVFKVRAEAADGARKLWDGFNWYADRQPRKGRKGEAGSITLHDESALDRVPPLLAPLGLKGDTYSGLRMRLTKKFPEVFHDWLRGVPPEVKVELVGELASLMSGDVAGRVKLEVTEAGIDWFDLRVVLDVGDTSLTPEEIKLLLNAKGGFVRLKGKGWRRLQLRSDRRGGRAAGAPGLEPARALRRTPAPARAATGAMRPPANSCPRRRSSKIQRRASEIKARVTPELPAGVTAQLRPYQLEGFHFLAYLATNRFGGILADDMGLGKTLQTLAWLLWLREQPRRAKQPRLAGGLPQERDGQLARRGRALHARAARAGLVGGGTAGARRRAGLGGPARAELQPAAGPGREPAPCSGRRSSWTKASTSRTRIPRPRRSRGPCAPSTGWCSPARPSKTGCWICGA